MAGGVHRHAGRAAEPARPAVSPPSTRPHPTATHPPAVMGTTPILCMSPSPCSYHRMGTFVAARDRGTSLEQLARELVESLRVPPSAGRLMKALQHMWGDVAEFARPTALDWQPPLACLTAIRILTITHQVPYLWESTALSELRVWILDAWQGNHGTGAGWQGEGGVLRLSRTPAWRRRPPASGSGSHLGEAAHRTTRTAYQGGQPTRNGVTHGTTADGRGERSLSVSGEIDKASGSGQSTSGHRASLAIAPTRGVRPTAG